MSDDGQKMSVPIYEMMWDCGYCGATKLLGKTHRHCPQCGAAQDPSSRYFPPESEKVAVQDHVYFGVDWKCGSCDTPNSNASAFCGNCGTPKDGAGKVDLAHERQEKQAPPEPAPEPPKKGGGMGRIFLGCALVGFLGFAVLCALSMFWTKSASLTVAGHSWERTIEVEEYGPTSEDDWCDDLPSGAYDVRESQKQRDTKQVPDGEDCTTKNVDNGDGTFRQEEECTTRYREEAIYDDWCDYTVDKWSTDRTARAFGNDLSPSWPDSGAKTCSGTRVGCQREGAKKQTYTVSFTGEDSHTCDFSESRWRGFNVGDTVTGEVSMVTGSLQCDSVK